MATGTVAEQLAELLIQNGVDVDAVAAAVQAKSANASTPDTNNAGNSRQASRGQTRRQTRTSHAKYNYGTAPTALTAVKTHDARVDALESAIPGISKKAYIFSVGKNKKGQLEKHLQAVENSPWTWVELPGGKDFSVGKLTPAEVRTKLAECGYGFSPSNGLWATDGKGTPVRRIRHYQAQQAGKSMLEVDD